MAKSAVEPTAAIACKEAVQAATKDCARLATTRGAPNSNPMHKHHHSLVNNAGRQVDALWRIRVNSIAPGAIRTPINT
jgi:hypothetical protein